jgi:hypothetical protein
MPTLATTHGVGIVRRPTCNRRLPRPAPPRVPPRVRSHPFFYFPVFYSMKGYVEGRSPQRSS